MAAVCGLLLLAVIAVFGQTAGHDFVNFDDDEYVYENQHVRGGFTGEGTAWAFTQSHPYYWHPLTWLSLMADAHVIRSWQGRLDRAQLATEMHLVNVALHAANSVILFLLLWGMTASVWRSACVAAVFAVHPLHVESVAWITERKDMLSGLFGLLTIGAYAWYARRPGVVRYLSVATALTLGLMAKPMLVTWPFVLLLLDYWPLRRVQGAEGREEREKGRKGERESTAGPQPIATPRSEHSTASLLPAPCSLPMPPTVHHPLPTSFLRLIVEKVPLLLLVAASAAVTFLAQRFAGSTISLESVSIPQRIARAAILYAAYLGNTVWPANLAAVYPDIPMESYRPALGAGVLLALLTAGAMWGAWQGQRWLAVGWFWYLGTLMPTVGLVQVGAQVMADRFLYLPQIGIAMALVWGAAHAADYWPRRRWLCAAAAGFVVAGLMVCAWQQTSFWRDSERVWNRALACTENNGIAHNNLGLVLADRGRVDEAILHYRKALQINPEHAETHNNLGMALADRGRVDESVAHFRKALEIKPGLAGAHNNLGAVLADRGQFDEAVVQYHKALEIKPDFAGAYNNLGHVLVGRGQFDEAVVQYNKALEINPDFAEAHYNLGTELIGRGQLNDAIAHLQKALAIKPAYAQAHYNLGTVLAGRGQLDEAAVHFREAVAIKPDYVKAYFNLGLALARRGRVDEAIGCFQNAVAIKPDYTEAHSNLGLALASRGRRNEALEHYQKALALASAHNDKALADFLRAQIKLLR